MKKLKSDTPEPKSLKRKKIEPRDISEDKVWFSLERKVLVRPYEPVTISVGGSISLEPHQTVENDILGLYASVKNQYRKIFKEVCAEHNIEEECD